MGSSLKKIAVLALLFLSSPLSAYNFLYIHPTEGRALSWGSGTTIRYYLDPGPMGRLTNDQAHTLLKEAMKVWEAIPGVPQFEFAGYLPEDVNGTNYQNYVSLNRCYTDDLDSCPTEVQKNLHTVIIFDEDNSILNGELCRIGGCSANAGAKVFEGSSSNPGNIVQGILVLGGLAGDSTTKINTVVGLMLHELGHLLGLAHTSINQEAIIEDLKGYGLYIPTMYAATSSSSNLNAAKSSATLNPDDIAGISALYPDAAHSTGTITGQIFKSDEAPMMHVNVIARSTEDPLCEAYSFLSGRSCELVQSICETLDPEFQDSTYTISGLPPGNYTIEVEEVASDGLGSTLAPGLIPDEDIFGDSEFWNDNDIPAESHLDSSVITLTAGEIRADIDIILNRNEVTEDRIQYIPLPDFSQAIDTLCPESPTIDYAALIGIDESSATNDDPSSGSSGGCSLLR